MNYAIETLEIELYKVKEMLRKIYKMEDEMMSTHPRRDFYGQKRKDLEIAIKELNRFTKGENNE